MYSKFNNLDNNASAMTTTHTENNKEDNTMTDTTYLNGEVVSQEEAEESLVPEIKESTGNLTAVPSSTNLMANLIDESDRAEENYENENENDNMENNDNAVTTTHIEENHKEDNTMTDTYLNGETISQEEVQERLAPEIKEPTGNLTAVPSSTDLMANLIDESDRAEENYENENDRLGGIWKLAQISANLQGMYNIRNVLDGRFYAGIQEDKNEDRHISYCQKYISGDYSPKMTVKQADLLTAIMLRNSDQYGKNKTVTKQVDKFFINTGKDYLGKFRGTPQEVAKIEKIMEALYNNIPQLSVTRDDSIEWNRDEFYARIVPCLERLSIRILNNHKSYFIFSKDELEEVAFYMKMRPLDLLQKLKGYGLLYLTRSSNGFQTNVRFTRQDGTTFTAWMYCVYNLEYLAGVNGKDSDDLGEHF